VGVGVAGGGGGAATWACADVDANAQRERESQRKRCRKPAADADFAEVRRPLLSRASISFLKKARLDEKIPKILHRPGPICAQFVRSVNRFMIPVTGRLPGPCCSAAHRSQAGDLGAARPTGRDFFMDFLWMSAPGENQGIVGRATLACCLAEIALQPDIAAGKQPQRIRIKCDARR